MSYFLPPTIALKTSQEWQPNYYLNYCDNAESKNIGFLRFNGGNVFSPLAKFEVVAANTGTGVHIRCFHNKKFLRMRSEDGGYISPEADEPEEEPSKWSCTLFEPQADEDSNPDKIRLFHVHTKQYVGIWNRDHEKFPLAAHNSSDSYVYDVIDLESLVLLPKHVAFKASNDLYLQHADKDELRFISDDKGIPESWFQVCTDGDARVKIKVFNRSKNNYLRFGHDNLIFADGGSSKDTPASEFWPVKIDDTTVALKCLNNDKFCTRHSGDGLKANNTSSSISKFSHLRLEELVLSRRIYNTTFDLRNAIIYGETPVTLATANASNNTSAPNTVVFRFTYKDSKSSTWGSSYSWMVGGSVSASFKIPFIGGGGKVSVSGSYTKSYQWGGTVTSENTLETTYTVTVPAHTTISVNLMATQGNCDVPYSYYQRDVLYNGKTVIYRKDDGLYTGVNSYNFRYEVTTMKEPDSDSKAEKPESDSGPKARSPDFDSDSKADLPTPEPRFPVPSFVPFKHQTIPLPTPYGWAGVQFPVTPSTNTPEQKLPVDVAATSSMKAGEDV